MVAAAAAAADRMSDDEAPDGLTPAALTRQRESLEAAQRSAVARVDALVRAQRDIGRELRSELALLRERGEALDAGAGSEGVVGAVLRRLTRRRAILARRSVTEGLLEQYESVSVSLRRASAFTDELQLCAAELQADIEGLHAQLARNEREAERVTARLRELERALAALDDRADPGRERERDQLQFELRRGILSLELERVSSELARKHLDPLRALRNTAMNLHEELARFVLAATATVDNAGRRIQALGMAADAPAVIADLQTSLVDLDRAMEATEAYVARANELLTRVLPELSAALREHDARENKRLTDELYSIDRERARLLSERSEQRDALAEVEGWFDE